MAQRKSRNRFFGYDTLADEEPVIAGNYVAAHMQRFRHKMGISRWKFNELAKVPWGHVYKWEVYGAPIPLKCIKKLAKAMDMTDLELRKLIVESEIRKLMVKYGFNQVGDKDKYYIKITQKKEKKANV